MDNQTIFKLIEKDLDELNDLVATLKNETVLSKVLIEIVSNKAITLQKEIQMLSATSTFLNEEKQPVAAIEIKEKVEEVIEETPLEKEVVEEEPEILIEPETVVEPKDAVVEEMVKETVEEEVHIAAAAAAEDEDEIETTVEEEIAIEKDLNIEAEPPKTLAKEPEEKKLVGERFLKGASLNDRMGKNAIHSKVKPKPISNLKSAIGINDRFLYQRELFENNAELMNKTIETIESVASIHEAVEHLDSNFTWSESETSLKFLDLIKRRFQN